MIPDRYQSHKILYIIGLLSLFTSLILLLTAVYILPYLFWGWQYDVPESVLTFGEWLRTSFNVSRPYLSTTIFLSYCVSGIFFGIISYIISNYIDNEIYEGSIPPRTSISIEIPNTRFDYRPVVAFLTILIGLCCIVWILFM